MVPQTFNICYGYTRRTYQKQLSVSNPSSRTSDDIANTLIGKAAQRGRETLATYFGDSIGAKMNKNYIASANVEKKRGIACLLYTAASAFIYSRHLSSHSNEQIQCSQTIIPLYYNLHTQIHNIASTPQPNSAQLFVLLKPSICANLHFYIPCPVVAVRCLSSISPTISSPSLTTTLPSGCARPPRWSVIFSCSPVGLLTVMSC